MLILSREIGQTLVIADDIEITILNVRGKQIRLGITAPRSIAVDRKEIYLRKKAERELADVAPIIGNTQAD